MTLDQAANYADIRSTLAIVGGIAFGLIQLSEYLRQRRDVIAAELMRTFYSVDLADAQILVRRPPATARLMNSESADWNTNGQPSLSMWP